MNRAEINLPIPSWIESADDYSRIVAQLNASWRVIECPDGIQWIPSASRIVRKGT